MKNTYEYKQNGDTVRIDYEYYKVVRIKTVDGDGYTIATGALTSTWNKATVAVNGKYITGGMPEVTEDGLKIGRFLIAEEPIKSEVLAMVEKTKEAGTDPEAIELEKKKKEDAAEKEKTKAHRIIKEAEDTIRNPDGTLMNKSQAIAWKINYNKVVNEGGFGYVPDIITQEQYDWAISLK